MCARRENEKKIERNGGCLRFDGDGGGGLIELDGGAKVSQKDEEGEDPRKRKQLQNKDQNEAQKMRRTKNVNNLEYEQNIVNKIE